MTPDNSTLRAGELSDCADRKRAEQSRTPDQIRCHRAMLASTRHRDPVSRPAYVGAIAIALPADRLGSVRAPERHCENSN